MSKLLLGKFTFGKTHFLLILDEGSSVFYFDKIFIYVLTSLLRNEQIVRL